MSARRSLMVFALLGLAYTAVGTPPLYAQGERAAQQAAKGETVSETAPASEAAAQRLTDEFLQAYRAGKHETALDKLEQLRALVRKQQSAKLAADSPPAEGTPFVVQKSPVPLMVEGRRFQVHFGSNQIYALKADPELSRLLKWKYQASGALQLAVEDSGRLAIQNRFVKIGDATQTIQYASSNPAVLQIDEKGGLKIEGLGRTDLTVSVGDASVRIPFQVLPVPLEAGVTKEKVIETLGIPDRQTKRYIQWLDSDYVDGIFYYANTKDGLGLSIDHWQYNRYPGVMLRFTSLDRLQNCAQAAWVQFGLTVYELEHGKN